MQNGSHLQAMGPRLDQQGRVNSMGTDSLYGCVGRVVSTNRDLDLRLRRAVYRRGRCARFVRPASKQQAERGQGYVPHSPLSPPAAGVGNPHPLATRHPVAGRYTENWQEPGRE